MGARAKRRLTWLIGIGAALVLAGGAVHHFTRSHASPVDRSATGQRESIGEQSGGIAFGASEQQVLKKLGDPKRRQAACWVYSAADHTVNGRYLGRFVDGMKYCFGDGPAGGTVVTNIYEHITAHIGFQKKHIAAQWSPAIVLAPRTAPAS
jgi:hypothetical protein